MLIKHEECDHSTVVSETYGQADGSMLLICRCSTCKRSWSQQVDRDEIRDAEC